MGEEWRTFRKPSRGVAADPLAGESGVISAGFSDSEFLQLFKKFVELKIADLRIVEHVVAVLVVADLLTQCVNFFWIASFAAAMAQEL